MNKKHLILLLPLLSLGWLVTTVIIGGLYYPDYSHVSQFMSELAATGAPHCDWVNYLGFIPAEVLMLLFLALTFSVLPRTGVMLTGFLCAAVYAVALGMAAFFPCDFECRPVDASATHQIHLALGAIAYCFGIVGMVLLAVDSRRWAGSALPFISGWLLGALALSLMLNLDAGSAMVGLMQRVMELCLYVWFVLYAFSIYAVLSRRGGDRISHS